MVLWRWLKTHLKLPPAGLAFQLFAIILLPLTILLVAITFGSVSIHNRAMRNMVGERDGRFVSTSAQALSDQIQKRKVELDTVALLYAQNPTPPVQSILGSVPILNVYFDQGVAAFDAHGNRIGVSSDESFWNALASSSESRKEIVSLIGNENIGFSVLPTPDGTDNLALVISATRTPYTFIGAFSITRLVQIQFADVLPASGDFSILLVGAGKQVLYKTGNLTDQSGEHAGVAEALQGQNGTLYVKVNNDEHVTAFSPVQSAGWALLTEESWQSVATPTLRTSLIAPLALVPAVLIMLLALYLSASQVVRPLRRLEAQASKLANGDFKAIQQSVGGIVEIQHLQEELVRMAGKVREAERNLHGYIGSITAAQEEERRRLARELHDDTLQALIALKQRVQLAQLELQPSIAPAIEQSAQLDEIASLTEQTIENLRRLSRDLRPVYLEDLGLAPALEMLARETSEKLGIGVEFHRQGTERRLEPGVELAMYRMAQEACNNITRHAQAKHASVEIHYLPETVTLHVQDDGIGFSLPDNPAGYASSGHYGLLGLRERAELIGATLEIRTAPGKGTGIFIALPGKEITSAKPSNPSMRQ